VRIEVDEPYPIPDDPLLAEAAIAMRDADDWGLVVDADWRLMYMADQNRLTDAADGHLAATTVGEFLFDPHHWQVNAEARYGAGRRPEIVSNFLAGVGGLVLADVSGGRDELIERTDPAWHDVVDQLSPVDATVKTYRWTAVGLNASRDMQWTAVRLRDHRGALHGTILLAKPALPAGIVAETLFQRDPGYLQRMFAMSGAGRRAGAVMFADLESSSALARRLSTASYFSLVRRIVRTTDQCVVDAGGLVGRHVGDGVVAFFPVECFASESDAAFACITAAHLVRTAMADVAQRSDLEPDELSLRFGLHWASTLFMGSITTSARTEVTGLGDEANEAARIEACATGGRTLASKQLVERLDDAAATALAIEPARIVYTRLADIDTATDKARRDAPDIAVCQL
jgi:class 3 adenylate cyclase